MDRWKGLRSTGAACSNLHPPSSRFSRFSLSLFPLPPQLWDYAWKLSQLSQLCQPDPVLATVLLQVGGWTGDLQRSLLANTTVNAHITTTTMPCWLCSPCFSSGSWEEKHYLYASCPATVLFMWKGRSLGQRLSLALFLLRAIAQWRPTCKSQIPPAKEHVCGYFPVHEQLNKSGTSPLTKSAITTLHLCFQVWFPCSEAPVATSPSLKVLSSQPVFCLSTK